MLMLKGHDPQISNEQHRSHRHLRFLLVTWSRVSATVCLCWPASAPFPSHPIPKLTPNSPEGASIPCLQQETRAWTSVTPWNGIFTHGMLIFNFIHASHIKYQLDKRCPFLSPKRDRLPLYKMMEGKIKEGGILFSMPNGEQGRSNGCKMQWGRF